MDHHDERDDDTAGDRLVAALAGTAGLPSGTRVGRYIVERELGRGGMGVVYAALDPELDRIVALKLVRAAHDDASASNGQARLLEEARMLARLSDPNVVAVFDVGTHEGEVYLAMEMIEGQTLKAWLREHRPSAPEILEVFRAAGRGLAAAHRLGIVHRDFKPDNVLVGRGAAGTGRHIDPAAVRVVDFGIAALGEGAAGSGGSDSGGVRGTMGYMSPEQLCGEPTDARSDQYSFCIALHLALFGKSPSVGAAGEAVIDPTRVPGVGDPLRAAIARGLSRDAAGRWPTIEALLEQLTPPATPRRRAVRLGVVGLGSVAAVTWLAWPRTDACQAGAARAEAMWGATARADLHARFSATGVPFADDAASRVAGLLDGWRDRWLRAHATACEADSSPAHLDCLNVQLADATALVELLRGADARAVERAVQNVAALPAVGDCTLARGAAGSPPPALADAVAEVRELLREARSAQIVGDLPGAERLRFEARGLAEDIDWPPIVAEVLLAASNGRDLAGSGTAAAEDLERAYAIARGSGHDRLALRAATGLVFVHGDLLRDIDAALRWSREAEILLEQYPDVEGARGTLLNHRGAALERAGRIDEAAAAFEEALAVRVAEEGDEGTGVAATHNSLGIIAMRRRDTAAAVAHFEQAVAISRANFGERHPQVATYLTSLGSMYLSIDDTKAARGPLEEALALRTAAFGPDSLTTAHVVHMLGICDDLDGDLDAALAKLQAALSVRRAIHPADHTEIADSHNSIGVVLARMGRSREAREHHLLSLGMTERRLGANHPDTAMIHYNLAQHAENDGQLALALEHYASAAAIWEAAYGAEYPKIASALIGTAKVEFAQGNRGAAIVAAERALILARRDGATETIAELNDLLARARAEP